MLSPVNYFDYDLSMESRNAILVHPLKGQAGAYEFDDNGVKETSTVFRMLPLILDIPMFVWVCRNKEGAGYVY